MDIRLITRPDALSTISDLNNIQTISHDLVSNNLIAVIGYLKVLEGLNINLILKNTLLYASVEAGLVLIDGIPYSIQGANFLIGRGTTDIGLVLVEGIDSNLEDPNTLYPKGADRAWRRYSISPTLTSIPLYRIVVDQDIVFIYNLHHIDEQPSEDIQEYVKENQLVKGLQPYWIGDNLWIGPGVYTYQNQLIQVPYPTYIGPLSSAELYADRYGVISILKDKHIEPIYIASDYTQLTNSLGYRLILDSITDRPIEARYLYSIKNRDIIDYPLFLSPRLLLDRLNSQERMIDALRNKILGMTRTTIATDFLYYDFTKAASGDINHPLFTATNTTDGLRPRTEFMIGTYSFTKGRAGLSLGRASYINPDRPSTTEINIPMQESLIETKTDPILIQYPSHLITNNSRLIDQQILVRIENLPQDNYLVYIDDIAVPIIAGSTLVSDGALELTLSLANLTRIPKRLTLVGQRGPIHLSIYTLDIYNPRYSSLALPNSLTIPLPISKLTLISELIFVSANVPTPIASNPIIGRVGIYDLTGMLLSMLPIRSRDLNLGTSIFNLDRVIQLLPGNYKIVFCMYVPGWVLRGIRYRQVSSTPERYEFQVTYPNIPNVIIDVLNEGLSINNRSLELSTDLAITNIFNIERPPYYLDLSFNRLVGLRYIDSTWISEELDGLDYSMVNLVIQCQPNGGQILSYISSDGGLTWLPLTLTTSRVINVDIDQRELTYTITNLSRTLEQISPSGDSNTIPRNRLRVRIDIKMGDIKSPPLIYRLGAYTSI